MAAVLARWRMRIGLPVRQVRPAASFIPGDRLVFGFVAGFCLALWTTSAQVLLTSETREGGRVLACGYFTGVSVRERQYLETGRASDQRGCPAVRVD